MNESNYKGSWQKHYGEYPYSETDQRNDLSPEEFAGEMVQVFESIGFRDMIQKEKVFVLASSVSSGKKDWEFLKKLDQSISDIKAHDKPEVILTDFAITKEGESVIEDTPNKYQNLNFSITAGDSYHLPFKDGTFKILYERLGALYHAADEDILTKTGGELTRKMLEEYKRVLHADGKIVVDWLNSRIPISTAENITNATKGNIEKFFSDMGFNSDFLGDKEGFLILTKKQKLEGHA